MTSVGLEVQDRGDVLTARLARRSELLPDVRGACGVPPFDSVRKTHVDGLGLGIVCLGHDTGRAANGKPVDHGCGSYVPRQDASAGATSGTTGCCRHGSTDGSSARGCGSGLSRRTRAGRITASPLTIEVAVDEELTAAPRRWVAVPPVSRGAGGDPAGALRGPPDVPACRGRPVQAAGIGDRARRPEPSRRKCAPLLARKTSPDRYRNLDRHRLTQVGVSRGGWPSQASSPPGRHRRHPCQQRLVADPGLMTAT